MSHRRLASAQPLHVGEIGGFTAEPMEGSVSVVSSGAGAEGEGVNDVRET